MAFKLWGRNERGFTIFELLLVAILMVIVMMIVAQFWKIVSPGIMDMAARWHVLRESRIARQSFASDFGSAVGVVPVGSDRLVVCRDAGEFPNGVADWAAPDELVDYSFSNNTLLRSSSSTGAEFTVADGVSGFTVEQTSPTLIKITLELACRNAACQTVFFWSEP